MPALFNGTIKSLPLYHRHWFNTIMPKVSASSVILNGPRHTPLETPRSAMSNNFYLARNESTDQIAIPFLPILSTVFDVTPPLMHVDSFFGYPQDGRSNDASFQLYPAAAPIDNWAESQLPTTFGAATELAKLTFSVESADAIAEHLSEYFSEALLQEFQTVLQPLTDEAINRGKIATFVAIGIAYTESEPAARLGGMQLSPLLTFVELKQLAQLTREMIDAPGFLTRDRSMSKQIHWVRAESDFGYPLGSDTAERHKVIIVIFALIYFANKDEPGFAMSMAPLTCRCMAGRSSFVHQRLVFSYLDSKPQLEEKFAEGDFNLAGIRAWAKVINKQNCRMDETRSRMRELEEQFKTLAPWRLRP